MCYDFKVLQLTNERDSCINYPKFILMKIYFSKALAALTFVTLIVFSCSKSDIPKENTEISNSILEQAELLAQMHNDGLDFINSQSVLKSTSSFDLKGKLIVTSIDFLNQNEEKLTNSFTQLKATSDNLDEEINSIFIEYPSITDIINSLSDSELFYYKEIQNDRSVLVNEERLIVILNKIVNDEKLTESQKLGVCSFVKTMQYSQKYWNENGSEWTKIISSPRLKSGEDVVLADGMYLWAGTLAGGPVVGVGAGAVASAFSYFTN